MPLHREIFWVGRQWAVTGHGMQAVDQKQKSKFDIEIARLWDDDLVEGLSCERWFNLADFSEGLTIARARFPAPPGKVKAAPKPMPPLTDLAKSSAATFAMRVDGGGARFTSMWRVRIKR